MIRQSLIMALEKYTYCDPLKVHSALIQVKQNEFYKKLRNELIMVPIPKSNDSNNRLNLKGSHFLERAVERVSFLYTIKNVKLYNLS